MHAWDTNAVRLLAEAIECFIRLSPSERLEFARCFHRPALPGFSMLDGILFAHMIAILFILYK